jgi:serine/threonine-protein kinase
MADPTTELHFRKCDPLPLGAIVDDRYELRRVLGRGSASVVFAAEHIRVRRPVALKLPLSDPELREILCARLRREVDALARVQHPAVVDVIDAGESAGMPYLAMELLEGRSLSGLIAARGRLQCEEAVKVGIVLAGGLAAVHACGLVHRDVKPSNVVVTRSPADQIHLCDFGVSKVIGATSIHEAKLTQLGAIVGTPEYMPLEALMASEDVDPRADVYALGILIFECLTGAVPVEGTLAEILLRLTASKLPRLSQIRPDVPAQLCEVVARCLEHEPAARFASMTDVAAALRACMPQQPDAIDVLRAHVTPTAEPSAAAANAASSPASIARREHARAPYGTVATLQRERGAAKTARIEDISEGGVLLISEETYAPDEVIRLRFGLPMSGRVITSRATVRWTRTARNGPATGVEFMQLPDDARGEIRQYIALMGATEAPTRMDATSRPSRMVRRDQRG